MRAADTAPHRHLLPGNGPAALQEGGAQQQEDRMPNTQSFFWYELMTSDVDAAEAFYAGVVGWRPESFGGSAMNYTVMNAADRGTAGLMLLPEEAKAMGTPPSWVGYIYASDVDAVVASLEKAGGKVHRPPSDIPDIGRFAVVADPQGATFMLMSPSGPDQPPAPAGTPGHIGWHELYASDWKSAFDFYSGQFGWTKGEAMDMGDMGTYQLLGEGTGAMMDKPAAFPVPFWLFYFNVPAIDAAAASIAAQGGKVLMGPHQVPTGQWVLQGQDPQGAMFALLAPGR